MIILCIYLQQKKKDMKKKNMSSLIIGKTKTTTVWHELEFLVCIARYEVILY